MDTSATPAPPSPPEPDFAAFDLLVEAIGRWSAAAPAWAPARRVTAEWDEVAPRLEQARRELSRVLVVGVVGGTGTGKSTLVNALAGAEVTTAGDVARPTTVTPVVIAARDVDVSWLPLDTMQARLVRSDSPAVASIVLVDCPDPDTQSAAAAPDDPARPSSSNRNRDLLEAVLPACDVLLLVSTAQKYRSWIVAREVAAFAPGRPLLFVQTHASRDLDIRDDWRRELESQGFDVPRIFRVDGVEAAARAAAGLAPEPGFRDLVAAIDAEFSGRAARRVRRTGALDLAAWFTRRARGDLAATVAPVAALSAGVATERTRLEAILARSIGDTLRGNRSAWQRLIGDDVVARWHGGPFASFLHVFAALGSLWNRVRPGTGIVGRLLAGQGAPGAGRDGGWRAVEELGLPAGEVEQSRSVLAGLAARAGMQEPLVGRARLDESAAATAAAAVVERAGQWLSAGIDRLVADRRRRVGRPVVHWFFEALFSALLVTVLGRAGWTFFHGTLWEGRPVSGIGFLEEAIVWVILWGLLLRWLVFALVRLGLDRDIRSLVGSVASSRLVDPLLADFSSAAAGTSAWLDEGSRLAGDADRLAAACGETSGLGRLRGQPAGAADRRDATP
jgi:energy-coupling factor transporter ATP-binding protein EcfA2